MEKIQSLSELEDAIKQLNFKKSEEEQLLKELFHKIYENAKPINIIKNIFKQPLDSPNKKDSLLTTSVGLGAGYLSKLLFQGVVRVPFKNLIGSALMLGVDNLIAKNPGVASTLASFVLNAFSSKSKSKQNIVEEMDYEHQDIHREPNENEPLDLETIY